MPQLAVSGIDSTVKIFSPDAVSQEEFAGEAKVSRKMMKNSYAITSQNEVRNESGLQEAIHSVILPDPPEMFLLFLLEGLLPIARASGL